MPFIHSRSAPAPLLATSLGAQQPIPVRQLGPVEATSRDTVTFLMACASSDGGLFANDAGSRRLILFDRSLTTSRSSPIRVRVVEPVWQPGGDHSVHRRHHAPRGRRRESLCRPRPRRERDGCDVAPARQRRIEHGESVVRRRASRSERQADLSQHAAHGLQAAGTRKAVRPADHARLGADCPRRFRHAPRGHTGVGACAEDHGGVEHCRGRCGRNVSPALQSARLDRRLGDALDGSVAILRGRDYHIDWINADGSRVSSPKMPFDWKHSPTTIRSR